MAQMGFSRLEHSSFGKSDKRYQPGMLAQHAIYISRFSASDRCITVNFSKNTHAFRREVAQYEEGVTRKNARLADKIIVNLDNRMDAEAIDDALRAFAISLTKGRARFRADVHMNDPGNVHAHIVFIDKSLEDGSKVAHLSDSPRDRAKKGLEPNGTLWLRKQWEKDCNNVLEDHGYEFRVDMRSRLDRGLDAAKEHVEYRADEPALESPEAPLAPEAESAETSSQEDDMIEREGDHPSHVHVKDALEYDLERRLLHHVRSQVEHHGNVALQAKAEREAAAEAARQFRNDAFAAERQAERVVDQLRDFTRPNGKLRGFEIFGWKTPKRARGEELTTEKNIQESRFHAAQKDARDAEQSARIAENRAREAELSAEAHQRELDALVTSFGDKATLESADRILSNSLERALSRVKIQEIYADFENGDLTGEEAKRAFEMMGEHSMAAAVQARMDIEEEMDPTGANDNGIDM